MSRDRQILYAAAFLRAVAVGMIGVLFGIYLAKLGFDAKAAGLIISAGLAGNALAALLTTLLGDRFGRRRTLLLLSILGVLGGMAAAIGSGPLVIGAAAFLGMLNGMGRDRGAALVLETAILPATAEDKQRTTVFAWYNVLQDIGHAVGSLLAGLPDVFRETAHTGELSSFRATVWVYAALLVAVLAAYTGLSPRVEAATRHVRAPLTRATKRVIWKISSLFALDSLGGGFLTTALLSFFFYQRFGASPKIIGVLFFGARVANAFSHLGAAWLARRTGLLTTMVFTHIPSSLLLFTIAVAPTFSVAALLFLFREGLVEMDVPTRQSYVMAVVGPSERTFAAGVTTLVRTGAWAVAPALAGLFMNTSLLLPLVIGSGIKVVYDVLLYVSFRRLRPPEES